MRPNDPPGFHIDQTEASVLIWRFELDAELSRGGAISAHRRDWNRATGELETNSRDEAKITVVDADDAFYGYAEDTGKAVWMPDARRWEILSIANPARWVKFTLKSALAADDSSQAIDAGDVVDSWDGRELPEEGITLHNEAGFRGPEDGVGYAIWRDSDQKWVIVQLECDE